MTAGYRTKEQRSITYNIHNIFLKGGKIVQMSPAEVLPSGGDWGSSGQDQQGCGHKVKLHSSWWPKINSMERQSGGLEIVGGESLCNLICNVKAWWICDKGGEVDAPTNGSCSWSFEGKVIDRSVVVAMPVKWWCGPHQQPILRSKRGRFEPVTAREGHNQPTQLTKIMSKCHAGA